jgi:hypothetical protein
MQNLKFGVVACGLLGFVGCFLPFVAGFSFFDTRAFDAANFYIVAGAFVVATVMGIMGVLRGMARWASIVAIVGFSVVILRMRGEMMELFRAGVGAKLIGIGSVAGLVFAILTTVKPEPVK